MDASCKVQGSIHVFRLNHKSMCPGFWVHITQGQGDYFCAFLCGIIKKETKKGGL